MNLQQFLGEDYSSIPSHIERDIRIINKVLSEVEREVENCLLKQYAGRATMSKTSTVWIERDKFKSDISTIINNLRIK